MSLKSDFKKERDRRGKLDFSKFQHVETFVIKNCIVDLGGWL